MFKLLIIVVIYTYIMLILILINLYFSIHININIIYIYIYLNINYINMWFIFFMACILFILVFMLSKKIISFYKFKFIILIYAVIYICTTLIIVLDDFICFIICFESLFFPICFVSLLFNFNNRFIFAIYYLIIFSSTSSILAIIVTIIILFHFNITTLTYFTEILFFDSLYLLIYIWILMVIIFGIKYPVWPLHTWLPELHVEVNTEMSVMLASIVLKMGFFGIFKFVFLLFNNVSIWFIGMIDIIIITGLLIITLHINFLHDYKKIIAYWSIIHTGTGLILLWHNDAIFITVLYLCNLGHIISSGLMFITIGYMYDNFGLRIFLILISFFGMSIWSIVYLSVFLFNIDFPFMLLFYIDLFVLYGLMSVSYIYLYIFAVIAFNVFISSLYIYVCLIYYSFIWLDKYFRIDIV